MNGLFYRDLREILLKTQQRDDEIIQRELKKWNGRLIITAGDDERPRVPQPNSDNDITGPTC